MHRAAFLENLVALGPGAWSRLSEVRVAAFPVGFVNSPEEAVCYPSSDFSGRK